MHRRGDLVEFLRARRAAVSPADAGLVGGGRRRTPGLRREEVALLAGVSVSWYTWLDQGRPINASVDVLDSLARVLRLDAVEREHLLALAGHPVRRAVPPGGAQVPEALRILLVVSTPARRTCSGPTGTSWPGAPRTTDSSPRCGHCRSPSATSCGSSSPTPRPVPLIVDWEPKARRVHSQFRADTVPYRDDPEVQALVARLHEASSEFAAWWPRHDVAGNEPRLRRFDHPRSGLLVF